jgi:hypothetical protein
MKIQHFSFQQLSLLPLLIPPNNVSLPPCRLITYVESLLILFVNLPWFCFWAYSVGALHISGERLVSPEKFGARIIFQEIFHIRF